MKNKKCDLCSNEDFKFLFKNYDRMYGIPGEFNLVRCKNCGLVFIYPYLNKNEIAKYYPKEKYYSMIKNPVEDFKIKLYNIFYSENRFAKKLLFAPFKFLVRKIIIQKGGNFLDVGCGDGKFLKIIEKSGMYCYGVEPNISKSIIEEKLKIFNCELEEAKFKKEFFDVITLNHVFEHVASPSHTLREINRILKKGGYVVIATPNIGSLTARIFGSKWFQLDTPRHLFLYSEKTIAKYAKKEGFKIEKITYNSTPLQFLCSMVYVLNQFRYKENILLNESGIPTNKFLLACFLPAAYVFNILKLGDQFEIVLHKK